jgi:hypothetical protein
MDVVTEVTQLHNEINQHAINAVLKGIRIGEILATTKESTKHGDWTLWVERNLPFSARMANNYIRMFDNKDIIHGAESSREALKLIAAPNRKRVSSLPKPFSGQKVQQETNWSKIQQSYNTYHTDTVTMCSKKDMKHQNIYEAIGHALLMDRDGINEVKKYVKRMLVQGESRDRLMEQLDEIEQECNINVSV